MAEKTSDLICRRLGVRQPCRTATDPLPSATGARWTKPGLAPREWLKQHEKDDILLCECEMVSKNVTDSLITSIHAQSGQPDLKALGLRSRIGKGTCQGTFCSIRISAYLYDIEELNADQGLAGFRSFLNERWRGVRPLLWDASLSQAELKEAIHCGLFGLELH
jgi:glycerol-3-phosphate dehydrogenase